MKDMITIFGTILVVCALGFVIMRYQRTANSQDSVFLALNETVKTEAMANASKGTTREAAGELYLNIPKFEAETRQKLSRPIASTEVAKEVTFRYLKGKNGCIKAIQTKMNTGEKWYQTTFVVDVHKGLK